jgi:small subunit ribosomal protein S1
MRKSTMSDEPASVPEEESVVMNGTAENPAPADSDDAAATHAGQPESTPPSANPDDRIQVGSRRDKLDGPSGSKPQLAGDVNVPSPAPDTTAPEDGEKAGPDVKPAPQPEPAPVQAARPSIHAPISEDLEQEIENVLGDTSLDDLISGESSARAGQQLESNSLHQGTVIRSHGEHVFISLGTGYDGVLPLKQLEKPPEQGEQLEVVVRSFNTEEGLYELSIPGAAIEVGDWSDLRDGVVVEARITGANTGGLECMVNQIRGFIPSSQIGVFRVEEFADYIGTKLPCVVTESNRRKKNLVLSHRAVMEREAEANRAEKIAQLQVGQTVEGVVRSLKDFGVFVDLGGIDGMVHISQLSWERIKHPSEVVTEGDKISVKIEKLDPQTGKISLSVRALQEHPWKGIASRFSSGQVVTGTVTRLADFGAFVKLAPAIEGLIHISELAHHRIGRVEEVLSEGGEVEVKILSVDPDKQRISLSLKQLQEVPPADTTDESPQAEDQPLRDLAVKRRKKPLKGGTDRASGGEQFGLNW